MKSLIARIERYGRQHFAGYAMTMVVALTAIGIGACSGESDTVSPGDSFAKPGSTTTAQSIGMTFSGVPSSVELGADTAWWTYDRSNAADYFEVTATSGGPNSGQINATFVQAVNDNKCTFWNGGTLSGVTKTFGPRSVTLSPKNTSAYPADVDPHTSWTLDSTHGSGGGDLDLQVDIAGESVVVKTGDDESPFTIKFSFSLNEGDDTRVNDVTYYLEQADGGGGWDVVDSYAVGDVTDLESGTWDFMYIANGGTFGTATSNLVSGYTEGDITDDAGGISGDDFFGNNSSLSPDSDKNAMVGHGPTHTFTVEEAGTYRFRVTATVKENDGEAVSSSFTASGSGGGGTVNIGVGNCE